MTTIKIKRMTATDFMAITDVVIGEVFYESDSLMELVGNVLKSKEVKGVIRIGHNMRISLGQKLAADINALPIGADLLINQ